MSKCWCRGRPWTRGATPRVLFRDRPPPSRDASTTMSASASSARVALSATTIATARHRADLSWRAGPGCADVKVDAWGIRSAAAPAAGPGLPVVHRDRPAYRATTPARPRAGCRFDPRGCGHGRPRCADATSSFRHLRRSGGDKREREKKLVDEQRPPRPAQQPRFSWRLS